MILNIGFILITFCSYFALAANEEFCKDRPTGLYCNPDRDTQKIECPSGNVTTCRKAPTERCQERGILRQYGFKGGIARCVPRLDDAEVQEFCEKHGKGVFCWGDAAENIRVQCPTGLVYKCRENEEDDGKVCVQKSEKYAICEEGGGSNVGSTTCLPTSITVVQTRTLVRTSTVTLTRTNVDTVTETTTLSPEPFVTTSTLTSRETVIDQITRTVVVVDNVTRISTSTSKITKTITPTVITDCPTTTDSTTVTVTTTSTTEDGGGGAAASTTVSSPSSTSSSSSVQPTATGSCPTDGSVPSQIPAPPGSSFFYKYTDDRLVENDVPRACRAMGGRMAWISSTSEHWYLGTQICEPVWYKRWQGNDFNDYNGTFGTTTVSGEGEVGCIALFPGGATATPVNQCSELLRGLCKFQG